MSKRPPVEVGQRYRTATTSYGTTPTEWQVVGIFPSSASGIEHARLVSMDGRSETMTLASSVVADRARFTRIDEPSA
jgi:hypothetical protein